jgi:hypothetical protein
MRLRQRPTTIKPTIRQPTVINNRSPNVSLEVEGTVELIDTIDNMARGARDQTGPQLPQANPIVMSPAARAAIAPGLLDWAFT